MHKKGHGIFVYALIYALIYLCTCVKERKDSLKFLDEFYIWSHKHRFSADLSFWREAHWVGGSAGRFDMWATPYTGILTLAKLKYFMSKDLNIKTL